MMRAHLAHLAIALPPTVARPSLLHPGALACMYVAQQRQGPGVMGHPPFVTESKMDRAGSPQAWFPEEKRHSPFRSHGKKPRGQEE